MTFNIKLDTRNLMNTYVLIVYLRSIVTLTTYFRFVMFVRVSLHFHQRLTQSQMVLFYHGCVLEETYKSLILWLAVLLSTFLFLRTRIYLNAALISLALNLLILISVPSINRLCSYYFIGRKLLY